MPVSFHRQYNGVQEARAAAVLPGRTAGNSTRSLPGQTARKLTGENNQTECLTTYYREKQARCECETSFNELPCPADSKKTRRPGNFVERYKVILMIIHN